MSKWEVQATVRIDVPVKTTVSADNLVRAVELSERLITKFYLLEQAISMLREGKEGLDPDVIIDRVVPVGEEAN